MNCLFLQCNYAVSEGFLAMKLIVQLERQIAVRSLHVYIYEKNPFKSQDLTSMHSLMDCKRLYPGYDGSNEMHYHIYFASRGLLALAPLSTMSCGSPQYVAEN